MLLQIKSMNLKFDFIKNKIITEDKIETMPIISSAIYNVSIEHRGRRFSYKLFYPPDITL